MLVKANTNSCYVFSIVALYMYRTQIQYLINSFFTYYNPLAFPDLSEDINNLQKL